MKLTTHTFVTLDGVMQAPGGPEEDPSGTFSAGGWIVPLFNEDTGKIVDEWFSKAEAFLLGRKTWQIFKSFWPQVDPAEDPTSRLLNSLPKYVVSKTISDQQADWLPTTILRNDFLQQIRELKQQPGGELQVHGSGQLIRALHDAGLIDEVRLIQFPVVLGQGKHLFSAGAAGSGYDVRDVRPLAGGAVAWFLTPKALPSSPGTYAVEDGKEVIKT